MPKPKHLTKEAEQRGRDYEQALAKANRHVFRAIEENGRKQIFDNVPQAIQIALLDAIYDPDASHRDKQTSARVLAEMLGISTQNQAERTLSAIEKIREQLRSPKKVEAEVVPAEEKT